MAGKRAVKVRRTWRINPGTRVKESGKRYRRQRAKDAFKKRLKER